MAIAGRCQPIVELLISHNPDFGLVNAANLTAAEMAQEAGEVSWVRTMIEAEFKGCDPVDALYELLKRRSLKVLELAIEMLNLSKNKLARSLAKAWNKLEVRNVKVESELELFVHLTLLRIDYEEFGGAKVSVKKMTDEEVKQRMQLVLREINQLESKFDTGLCDDVCDEFLERLRLILRQLFVLKNRIEYFPVLQLEYCVAVYLAIYDRKPELDLFQLAINKRLIVQYLVQLKRTYESIPTVDRRMSVELLYKLTMVIIANRTSKCKQIIARWAPFVGSLYKKKELIMIRNKIVKSLLTTFENLKSFRDLSKDELSKVKTEAESINKLFETRKYRYRFGSLLKLYFRLKQMYSLQKTMRYLEILEKIELHTNMSCLSSTLAIQRVLQVVGETLKATKLSPNISTNLRNTLEFASPANVLSQICKLRNYFSHDFSMRKHSVYTLSRENDEELIEIFRKTQADLMKIIPLIDNILKYEYVRYVKAFLSFALQLKSANEVKSFANACKVSYNFKLNAYLNISDIPAIENILNQLKNTYCPSKHCDNLNVLAKIQRSLKYYQQTMTNVADVTNFVIPSIGALITNDSLEYQHNSARFLLKNISCPQGHEYGVNTLIMYSFKADINKLIELETTPADDRSNDRLAIIHELMKLALTENIGTLQTFTVGQESLTINHTKRLVKLLELDPVTDVLLSELDKSLTKYYSNLFALDNKYRTVKTFCKHHKLNYNNELVLKSRIKDERFHQKAFDDLIQDIARLVSLPQAMDTVELVTLVASFQKLLSDSPDLLAIEIVLLEVLNVLTTNGVLQDNRTTLSLIRPVVSGRNLRNYLAHDSLVYDTLCRNGQAQMTVFLNAICLTKYVKFDLFHQKKMIMNPEGTESFEEVHHWTSSLMMEKKTFFENLTNSSFHKLNYENFECKARLFNKCSVLETVMDKHSKEFIEFLIGRKSPALQFFQMLLRVTPNQMCNFYEEDSFFIRDVVVNATLRQNMGFYMSVKYKYYDLEADIGSIYGAVYEADSLSVAILFGNSRTALSIIESSNLYEFCTADTLRHDQTVMMLATLYKQPEVVRAICEKSPQMLECTNTSDESALYLAVGIGSKAIVKILLEFGANPHHPTKSAIVNALLNRKDDILEMLLPSDEKLILDQELLGKIVNKAGLSNHHTLLRRLLPMVMGSSSLVEALNSAALRGHLEAVEVILKFNPSIVNEQNSANETALFNACYSRSRRIVELLLRYGGNRNLPEDYLAVDDVVEKNQRKVLKLFIDQNSISEQLRATLFEKVHRTRAKMAWMVFKAGYPCRIINRHILNNTLQLYLRMIRVESNLIQQIDCYTVSKAILLRNEEFVKCVLDVTCSRMSVTDRGRLINSSVRANDKGILKYLIGIGCEVNQPDYNGVTPLGLAVILNKPDLIRILLKAGADANVESTSNGPIIIDAWSSVGPTFAKQLQEGSYVTYPILFAIALNHHKIVEYLVQYGADVEVCDRYGITPLIGAILAGNRALVEFLLSHGANIDRARRSVDSIFHSGTVLHNAAKNGHLQVFRLLVEQYDFDMDVCDPQGNTALHVAVQNDRVEIVSYLQDSVHWNTANKSGEIPLDIALTNLNEVSYTFIKQLPGVFEYMKYFRDEKQRSVLHFASSYGRTTNFLNVLLVELELEIDALDEFKQTPLHYALSRFDLELVKFFVSRGASLGKITERILANFLIRAVLLNKVDHVRFCLQQVEFTQILLNVRGADCNLLEISIFQDNMEIFQLLLDLTVFDVSSIQGNGNTTLHFAAGVGSVRIMDMLLREGVQLENVNQRGKSLLFVAIEYGNWKVAKYLLSKGASKQSLIKYRYPDTAGMNVVHHVASTGRLASLKILLDEEVFARTVPDEKGRTIGHYAAANNRTNVVDYLVAAMFPLDMEDEDGRSSLVYAIEHEHLKLAQRLISVGCSRRIVYIYNEKNKLLKRSIENGKVEIIMFLKEYCNLYDPDLELATLIPETLTKKSNETKAHQARLELLQQNKISELHDLIAQDYQPIDTVNSLGRTLLHESVLCENFEAVKTLLKLGMPLESLDTQGTTPLILALMKNNQSLAKYLINAGASLESVKQFRTTNRDQSTMLHVAAQHGLNRSLKLLLEQSIFDVDVGDFDQTTPLQEAACRGHKSCVELLLMAGADVEYVDLQGTNTLTRAFCGSQEEIVQLLLERQVSLDNAREFRVPNSKEESLLHLVASGNNPNLIGILVEIVGIAVDVLDSQVRTALHYAAEAGAVEAVERLLKNGASKVIVDESGSFPLIVAIKAGHGDRLAELLLPESVNNDVLETFRIPECHKSVLHLALESKCYHLLRLLINDHKINAGLVDSDGRTILHYASAEGSMLPIEHLNLPIDLFFALDCDEKSPLSICVTKGDESGFKSILGQLIKCEHDHLNAILHCIVRSRAESLLNQYSQWLLVERMEFVTGNKQILEVLRAAYSDLLLELVIMNNHVDTLRLLISSGLDKAIVSECKLPLGVNFLHVAALKNFDNLANIFINQLEISVESLDDNQQTPLAYAVHLKHLETVNVLLEHKANANCLDKNGRSPLLTALEHDDLELVQLLLSHGASLPLVEEFRYKSENKFTPLHFMAERGLTKTLPLVLPAMQVNCLDDHGLTPLHYAAATDQRTVIELLMGAGSTIDAADKHGSTPLLRAVSKGHMECFELLRRHGANVELLKRFRNSNYDNESMLHITAEKGLLEMTKMLVEEYHLDVDCQDKDGNTPLHCAIGKERDEVVKYLLRKKANLFIENGKGITPLTLLCNIESDFKQPEET